MKFFLVVLAIIGLTAAAPARSLQDDFDDFLKLIPVDKIREIFYAHLANDKEVQDAVKYLQGDEWAGLVAAVAANPQYQALKDDLRNAGIDVDAIIQRIHDFIHSLQVPASTKSTRTLRELVDEIKAVIPLTDLIVLLNDKLQNSPDFIAFYEKASSEETKQLVEEVRALPEVQRLAAVLKEKGIDVTAILELIYGFLGWD